ncbi:protein phosphatase 2CA [Actinidia rufa]|uniref:Protein phosphatase 2CA n=1 Tax=Actinidia rufa TaxID=165716 RepID=A0A7J0GW81_9ERIC|nr:protein phosphatase 2CA [Actinidia rufa]
MAGMCCGVVGETEASATVETSVRAAAKRRRMEIRQFKLLAADMAVAPPEKGRKRQKVEVFAPVSPPRDCENAVESCVERHGRRGGDSPIAYAGGTTRIRMVSTSLAFTTATVAMKCKDRLHDIVRDELEGHEEASWKETMEQSFSRMDKEVTDCCSGAVGVSSSNCRCELQTPQCDAVGSTAVIAIVTSGQDRRLQLRRLPSGSLPERCRNSALLRSQDRPDELDRIENAGGRVIYWDGPRVLGVLAMSRAIGDNYLKPFVIPEPEVTVTNRTAEDECLILASDGLWDVVSNETASGVARMCLQSRKPPSPPQSPGSEVNVAATGECSDKACSDASILLTKLALARHSTDNISVVVVDLRRGL